MPCFFVSLYFSQIPSNTCKICLECNILRTYYNTCFFLTKTIEKRHCKEEDKLNITCTENRFYSYLVMTQLQTVPELLTPLL